jgi:hypothetical protein
MTVTYSELMMSIEALPVSAMREMAQHLLERAQAKELRATMFNVIADQRVNPQGFEKQLGRATVNGAPAVTEGRTLDDWKGTPGTAAIDMMLPGNAAERQALAERAAQASRRAPTPAPVDAEAVADAANAALSAFRRRL